MLILALNTATQKSGAALVKFLDTLKNTRPKTSHLGSKNARPGAKTSSARLLAEKTWFSRANDSEKMLPAITALLESQKLDFEDIQGVLVVTGPGSFTSLRVGVTIANGLAYSLGCPIYALDTFSFLQARIKPHSGGEHHGYLMVNAGRDQVFVQEITRQKPVSDRRRPTNSCCLRPARRQPAFTVWPLAEFLLEIAPAPIETPTSLKPSKPSKPPKPTKYYYAELSPPQKELFRKFKPAHLKKIPTQELFTFGEVIARMKPSDLKKLRLAGLAEPFYHKPPDITLSKKLKLVNPA